MEHDRINTNNWMETRIKLYRAHDKFRTGLIVEREGLEACFVQSCLNVSIKLGCCVQPLHLQRIRLDAIVLGPLFVCCNMNNCVMCAGPRRSLGDIRHGRDTPKLFVPLRANFLFVLLSALGGGRRFIFTFDHGDLEVIWKRPEGQQRCWICKHRSLRGHSASEELKKKSLWQQTMTKYHMGVT